jgi:hypothetical protein
MCFISDIPYPMNEERTTPFVLTLNAQVPGFLYTLILKIKNYIRNTHEVSLSSPQCHQTRRMFVHIHNKFFT